MASDRLQPDRYEALYLLLALVGLAGTWAQGWGYLAYGLVDGNVRFWRDAFASPAGAFIAVDVLVVGAAVFAWIFGESRRLGISSVFTWACFVGSLLVAISFCIPLFLAVRHRHLRRQRPQELVAPAPAGAAAIVILVTISLLAAGYSLTHVLQP